MIPEIEKLSVTCYKILTQRCQKNPLTTSRNKLPLGVPFLGQFKTIEMPVSDKFQTKQSYKYILLDGLTYNTRGYFASCVVFFRAQQGRGKMRAMSKMSASNIC